MANKRDLKKKINEIFSILYEQCSAVEHSKDSSQITEVEGVIKGILFSQDKILTACNKVPRKGGRDYFKKELPHFKERILELIDQVDQL